MPVFSLRVNGMLRFAADQDSCPIADTSVITSAGRLEIGTASKLVEPDVRAGIWLQGNATPA
ncbi:MAG: hypothetical protein C0524_02170 [Rhodobacter sp.]|nr:hypothetical protein [Rhodobacter sp.]